MSFFGLIVGAGLAIGGMLALITLIVALIRRDRP
jgi:hypothetical protein